MEDPIPPQTPPAPPPAAPPHTRPRPAQPRPRTLSTGGAGADGRNPAARGSGAEPAQGEDILHHQGEELPPPGASRDWVRYCDAIPDPLGGKALPLVMEVYGWLSWATSGTTRGRRNRPFEAVLLRRDGGN